MTKLSDYDLDSRCEATVKQSQRITPENAPEVRNIVLTVSQAGCNFREGQLVGVLIPGPHAMGQEAHFRLYTIAGMPGTDADGSVELELCVRRCFYLDEVSGEEYPGVASNFLCNAKPGDTVTLTGPHGEAFTIPKENDANLLMIGTGTGIAPFRGFVRHIYEQRPDWKGKVQLFYGARNGMEKLYLNDQRNDFANYYDQETFQAFEGLSSKPWLQGEEGGLSEVLEEKAEAVWEMIQEPKTHLYLAGLTKSREEFYKVMAKAAGSKARLRFTREEMTEQGRWSELTYG